MGLFGAFFKNAKSEVNMGQRIELVTERGNGFYAWNGNLYKSDIIRSCIRPKSRAIGKLVAKHIREDTKGIKINPEAYMKMLLFEPNPYMTGQMLQERLMTQLMLNSNAFALIIRDENGYPIQIYPIPCQSAEVIYGKEGDIYMKFTLPNGKTPVFSYSDIIHLRRDYYNNDMFGESPMDVLAPVMEIINTTDQGIVKAIKNSNIIRYLLKFKMSLKDEDIKKHVEDFTKSFLTVNNANTGGAAAVDAKYDLEQLKQESYVPNAQQMDRSMIRLFNFFNTNEKIIQSKWSEDEWTAYYEAEIEPDAVQMSGEFTRKLFSRKQIGFGNRILFVATNLQHASMVTKLKLSDMVDRGAMTPNEWRETMNMGPIEGGEKAIRRLDTAPVGGDKGGKD